MQPLGSEHSPVGGSGEDLHPELQFSTAAHTKHSGCNVDLGSRVASTGAPADHPAKNAEPVSASRLRVNASGSAATADHISVWSALRREERACA